MATGQIIFEDDVRDAMAGLSSVLDGMNQARLQRQIQKAILSAEQEFQRELKVRFRRTVVQTYPTGVQGTDYDLQDDPYDLYQAGSGRGSEWHFTLRYRPILSVERIALDISGTRTLLTYPADWIRLDRRLGTIALVPVGGAALIADAGVFHLLTTGLPMLASRYHNGVVPKVVTIDYTAGYDNPDTRDDLADVRLHLAKAAALHLREMVVEAIPQSVSRDGVSVSLAGGQQMFTQLATTVEAWKQSWKRANAPVPAVIL
jgi:hypothetical protein